MLIKSLRDIPSRMAISSRWLRGASRDRAFAAASRTARRSPSSSPIWACPTWMAAKSRLDQAASARTPVIMLTGWGQAAAGRERHPGARHRVLSKPPRLGELRPRSPSSYPRDPADALVESA